MAQWLFSGRHAAKRFDEMPATYLISLHVSCINYLQILGNSAIISLSSLSEIASSDERNSPLHSPPPNPCKFFTPCLKIAKHSEVTPPHGSQTTKSHRHQNAERRPSQPAHLRRSLGRAPGAVYSPARARFPTLGPRSRAAPRRRRRRAGAVISAISKA